MTLTTSTNLSPNHYNGRQGHSVRIIGIHTMEAPEAGSTAEDVARYFGNSSVQASSHFCVDDNSRVRVVKDDDAAWTMPPLNDQSLNVEMAGYAAQTFAQWNDAYSQETIDNVALCVAEWCLKYAIPVRHLTDAQLADGEKGIVGHVDVNRVFHMSSHTDPGPNFPWTEFLSLVNKHLCNAAVATPPKSANCKELQQAVRSSVDGVWKPNDDDRIVALVKAWDSEFPFGVKFAQHVVGTAIDGSWGPASITALKDTTAHVQRALVDIGLDPGVVDGVWGPNTERAYNQARKFFTAH